MQQEADKADRMNMVVVLAAGMYDEADSVDTDTLAERVPYL